MPAPHSPQSVPERTEPRSQQLRPTHQCFDDAMLFFIELGRSNASKHEVDQHVIVHALCRAPDRTLYVHAWVEHSDGYCIGAGLIGSERVYVRFERAEFYRLYEVEHFTVYTVPEMLRASARFGGTGGPWEPRYRAIANRRGKGPRVWEKPTGANLIVGTYEPEES